MAEVNDVSDTQYVEYFTTLNKNFRAIAGLAKLLNQAGVKGVTAADAAFFEEDANGYTDQAAIYQKAVDRNRTMIPFIARGAKNEAQALPIAFIGSFHTHGIVKALQEQGISYVVIEPRPLRASTANESREFEQAIHPNTREGYLTKVALNMGGVAPAVAEVKSLYAPRMTQKATAIRADRAATAAEFVAVQGAVVDVSRLHAVADSNATLAGVVVSTNGNGMNPPPPGRFGGAFAFFDAGDGKGGSRPRLVVMDPRDNGWRNEERYQLLERAVLLPADANNPSRGMKMRFYTGPNLMLAVCYDRATDRTYLVEGKKATMASFLPAALMSGGQSDVRTSVTEIFVIRRIKNG